MPWRTLMTGAAALACLAAVPAVAAEPSSDRWGALADTIREEMRRLHIPGAAVAVLEDGELAWSGGFGFADLGGTVAVTPSTRFMIGSTTKVLIALAIMQLVEAGELRLDGRVVEHLPELGEAYGEVTIGQLLSHTAGIRRDGKRPGPPPYLNHQVWGAELLDLVAGSPPEYAPGAGAGYSNLGPALAALVVERATGRSIEEHLQKAVFEPAGMRHTRYVRATVDPTTVDGLAEGTVWTGSRWRAAGHEARYPTGALASTAADLAAFVEALLAGRLVAGETLERMWTVQELADGTGAFLGRDGVGRGYGGALGWFVHRQGGRSVVHHGGSREGYSSQVDVDRDHGRTVIVLANNEAGPAGNLAWAVLELLNAGGPAPDPVEPLLAEVPFDAGRWRFEAAQSRLESHLGRPSLLLRDGSAVLDGPAFTDGVLEVDVAFTDERGFLGLVWRRVGAGDYEQFYLRPHQSGNPDANQYTPAFGGLTSWQLYHGPGYGAPVEYRFDDWNRVRVVVAGARAEIYVNDLRRPAVVVPELRRPIEPGALGLTAFGAPAHFSRFRVFAGEPPALGSTSPEPRAPAAGAILAWEVSDPFDWAALGEGPVLPAELAQGRSWRRLAAAPGGLANLARVATRGDGRNAVLARVTIASPTAQTVRLRFGYSDTARVFLDGRALYDGDNRYRSRDYRYLGTIGYFDELFLPLAAGDNQLWVAVGESFGGWGLQARLLGGEGLVVSP